MNQFQQSEQAIPPACSLTPGELVERRQENSLILTLFQQVRELDDGYAFQYPGDAEWLQRLATFIIKERACCLFFTFELVCEPDLGSLWLRVRGGEGVKGIVRDQWLTPSQA